MPEVRFGITKSSITLGEPVYLTIICINEDDQPQTIDLGANYEGNLLLNVGFPDGKTSEIRQEPREGLFLVGVITLEPHTRQQRAILLNELLNLAEVGSYTFQLSLKGDREMATPSLQNNVVYLLIGERDEAVLQRRCQELVEQAESANVGEKMAALKALGYTRDAVAVPYLRKWLVKAGKESAGLAFQILGVIGGDEAARALLPEAEASDPMRAADALANLSMFQHTISDPALKNTVSQTLSSFKRPIDGAPAN